MSASETVTDPANPTQAVAPAVQELMEILQRLAALNGELSGLESPPLDSMLTAKQAAKWLQCSERLLNKEAKAGRIPAVPRGNEFRFHPRTILAAGHARYFNRK